MQEIDLRSVFRDAFGYDAPREKPVIQNKNDFHYDDQREKPKIENAPARNKFSNLGQPYYDEDIFGREFFMPVRLDGVMVSFAVIGCTWKKTIVSTPMPERGGSVKESISIDDYLINIKGILINPGNDWPEAGVMEMFKLFKQNQSVTLRSALTDIFLSGKSDVKGNDPEGHRVVIKEIKWPAVSGVEHAKPFEIECESDMILDLEIVEPFSATSLGSDTQLPED